MPSYNADAVIRAADPRVVNSIIAIGRERGLSDEYILTALATGIVEDSLRHSASVRDGTSVGWRQETRSSYGSTERRMDLAGSINRFYDELAGTSRRGSLGMWAAAVQRPAAQYRGRYDQAMGAARAVLARFGGGAGLGEADAPETSPQEDGWDPRAALGEMISTISEFTKQRAGGLMSTSAGLGAPTAPDDTVGVANRLVAQQEVSPDA